LPQVQFSGKKWDDKLYRWHTGFPGGLKQRTAKEMLERKPEAILQKAVMGMLKRNNLRHQALEPRLKIYLGSEHPHTAQLPPSVAPLPSPGRKMTGDFHFGLEQYTSENGGVLKKGST
jgi:ribosomal protein L13